MNIDRWRKPRRFSVLFLTGVAFLLAAQAAPARAQQTSIEIYSDAAGTTCGFSDHSPGFFNAYVIVRPGPQGVSSLQFAAPAPECFTGAYVGEQTAQGAFYTGNSQTGISVAMVGCFTMPTRVLTVQYYGFGTTPSCCALPVVAHPTAGEIVAVDCNFNTGTAVGVAGLINGDEACADVCNRAPFPPGFPDPGFGSEDVATYTTLSWQGSDPDNNIAEYDVYFGTDPVPPLAAAALASPSWTPPSLLEPLTTYYWRVVARDTHGLQTSGDTWYFTTRLNVSPAAPFLPSPPDGGYAPFTDVTLAWSASDPELDPLTYDVYFGDSQPPPLVSSSQIQTSYPVGTLPLDVTHYWKIVVRDAAGLEAEGPVWSFMPTSNLPPAAPFAPQPPHGATNRPPSGVTLQWSCSDPEDDAITYDVYLGTASVPPLVASDVDTTAWPTGALTQNTIYRWRIVARDALGFTTSGPTWEFRTRVNTAPFFVSLDPPSGSTGRSLSQVISWSVEDLDGDMVLFDVYFGTTSPPPQVADDTAATSYTPGLLEEGTLHYWRVVARDAEGAEEGSGLRNFTTKVNTPPATPSNPVPSNDAVAPVHPLLSWSSFDLDGDPLSYFLYFGTDPSPPLLASGLTEPGYDPGPLEVDTRYYWRVLVTDGKTYSAGPTWTFATGLSGDVDHDGQVTLADAACALRTFVQDLGCLGGNPIGLADVNCDGAVTPADAQCIHRNVHDGSCSFCAGLADDAAPAITPTVSAGAMWQEEDTLVVRLTAAGVPSLGAFGFRLEFSSLVQFVGASRAGATTGFTDLASEGFSGIALVGGYALSGVPASDATPFIELRFLVPDNLIVLYADGFTDDLAGATRLSIPWNGTPVPVSVMPRVLALGQNRPNPFNPQTAIPYTVPDGSAPVRVQLFVLDTAGRVVRRLVDEQQAGGSREVMWDGKDDRGGPVSSGVYFYVLDAGGKRLARKLVLLK